MEEKSYALVPPEGDKNVGKRVFQVLAAVLADKESLGLPKRWNRNYKLRRNRHWKQESGNVLPLVSANLIFTHIQRSTNALTDNNPTFNVTNMYAGDDETQKNIATDIQRAAEDWWLDTEQQDKLESSVLNGETYGICIEKVLFNTDLNAGLGDVETRIVDPMHFGWYPVKLSDLSELQKKEAVVEFYVKSCRKLREEYPKLANEIKADTDLLKELNDTRRDIDGQNGEKANNILIVVQSVVRQVMNYFKANNLPDLDNEETVVCEMWLRDKTRVDDGPPEKNDAGDVIQNRKPKYTGEIRYILACSGGNVVLRDEDNPNINSTMSFEDAKKTYLFDKFPYAAANSVKDTSNAWGISDVEQVEKLNMELNKSLSQLVLEKDKSARKKLINPRDSGVQDSEFTNYPAILHPSSAAVAAGIKYLEVPQSSIDIEKSIQLFKELFLLIAGTFDLDQAQTQSNVIAYKAIAALIERAATMMRGKIRSYSRLIRERGRMYVSHVQNFYTEDRWVTFKDDNGIISVKKFRGNASIIPVNLTVVSGSTLPISRIQQREEAIELFKLNAIDQQELLERLDWGNRNAIIKRMQAGPMGAALDKLSSVNIPPEIMEYLRGVIEADPKKLQQALKSGEYPTFDQVMQELIKQNMPDAADQQTNESPELAEARARVKKLEAESALIAAKAQTEAVNQEVKLAGIQFDDDKMKLERAAAVSNMEREIKNNEREDRKAASEIVSNLNNRPGYNEKGMMSNNEQR